MSADRTVLRQQLRGRRRALPASQRIAAADALADQLLSLPFAPRSGLVAGYWAVDGEIALHAWQLRLPSQCRYCLPVLHDDGQLRFAPWRPGDSLVGNRFGIPEPDVPADALLSAADMTLVVLPLVGYDHDGHRLGMGGGWYDRSFGFRHDGAAPPWLVGAAFSVQRVDALAREDWDVRLDALCNEREALVFDHAGAGRSPSGSTTA
jgi:5-formyltetrahydrofolate cyclo-ligase